MESIILNAGAGASTGAAEPTPAEVIAALEQIRELITFVNAANATRYLTVAALVMLVYDHVLLLDEEVTLIWSTKAGWLKRIFYFNRYTVPIFVLIGCFGNSGLIRHGLNDSFCKIWNPLSITLLSVSLLVSNIFIIQRVYALWNYNTTIWWILIGGCSVTYAIVIGVDIYAATLISSTLSYDSAINACVVSKRPKIAVYPLAIPIVYDLFLFALLVRNGLSRPTHLRTSLVKRLHVEGAVFFFVTIGLRLMNIVIISSANLAYATFSLYFFWATITTTVNRMLLMLSSMASKTQRPDPFISGIQLEISKVVTTEVKVDPPMSLRGWEGDMEMDTRESVEGPFPFED